MRTKQSLSLVALVSALALAATPVAALGAGVDKHGKSRERTGVGGKDRQDDKKHGRADKRVEKKVRKIAKNRRHSTAPRVVTGHDNIVVIDRAGHLRVVREFYAGQSLPPGLAKRESLPSGLSKQLRERGHLPPGLRKRLRPVPPDLASRLPPVPPYYHRYFAGRDLLIVDARTNRIVSVIRVP